MKPKPTVGQQLFILNVGNAARHQSQVLIPVTVVKVGRKYFTTRVTGETRDWTDQSFHIDTWRQVTEYTPSYDLYTSEQEWHDEKHAAEIHSSLREAFSGYGKSRLSLTDLRRIRDIISASKP